MEWEPRKPRILLDEMSEENKDKMAKRPKAKGRKLRRKVIFKYPKTQ